MRPPLDNHNNEKEEKPLYKLQMRFLCNETGSRAICTILTGNLTVRAVILASFPLKAKY